MTDLPDPISRRDRQRQTREALIFAARAVFAEVGYHAANLDRIARRAGFSKGAVYSNFEDKAALFLAVMDANLETAFAEGGWDVFERISNDTLTETQNAELTEAVTGFALATLEFVAAAARDEQLSIELGKRMRVVADAYTDMARASRTEGERLSDADLGTLLTALDQGAAVLTLAGGVAVNQRLLRAGMQRLLDPSRAHDGAAVEDRSETAGRIHDEVVRQRIADALRDRP